MMKIGGPIALAIAALGETEETKKPKEAALRVVRVMTATKMKKRSTRGFNPVLQ